MMSPVTVLRSGPALPPGAVAGSAALQHQVFLLPEARQLSKAWAASRMSKGCATSTLHPNMMGELALGHESRRVASTPSKLQDFGEWNPTHRPGSTAESWL